jgi:hypothetical protein
VSRVVFLFRCGAGWSRLIAFSRSHKARLWSGPTRRARHAVTRIEMQPDGRLGRRRGRPAVAEGIVPVAAIRALQHSLSGRFECSWQAKAAARHALELRGMSEFVVRSAREGGRLEVHRSGRDRWRVSISLPHLTASADVDAFAYDGEHTLERLFRRMADDWRGWEGERTWSSPEGDLDLSATHDGLGHVALEIRLRSGLHAEDWLVRGTIWLDAGQLNEVARKAAALSSAG